MTLGSLSKGKFFWVSFLRHFKKITRNVSSETGEVNGLFNKVPFVQAQRPESGFPACTDTCIMAYVCNHSAGGQGGHGYPLAATQAEPVALKFWREILRINFCLPHTPHKQTLSMSSL